MTGEIIAIGDELISGRVVNTTSTYIAKRLFENGFGIRYITTIGDDRDDIKLALEKALYRSDFVIITGGLGPTDDDITTEVISSVLNLPLVSHPQILKKLREHKTDCYWDMPDEMKVKLSLLPHGAINIDDNYRFAGFHLIYNNKKIYCLPGVPSELEVLLESAINDLLQHVKKGEKNLLKVFRVFGISEAEINRRLKDIIGNNLKDIIKIGFYPHYPEVLISVSAHFINQNESSKRFYEICEEISKILDDYVVSDDIKLIEEVVGELLLGNKMTLSLAESCTGGLIAKMITSVSGASKWFNMGVVTYSNASKERILNVNSETLIKFGAVSKETAFEMLNGLRKISQSDYCISVTGIAGPDGGTPEKPVGTVYIALGTPNEERCERFNFSGSRIEIQTITAHTALNWLRRTIKNGKIVHCH